MKKQRIMVLAMTIGLTAMVCSCGVTTGAGGTGTSISVGNRHVSDNSYDLVPVGSRITYTIDISTPEGAQKLNGLTLQAAQRLAEVEASRKYDCDRLIDPRFDYLRKGKRILRITVDGRPGVYRAKRR